MNKWRWRVLFVLGLIGASCSDAGQGDGASPSVHNGVAEDLADGDEDSGALDAEAGDSERVDSSGSGGDSEREPRPVVTWASSNPGGGGAFAEVAVGLDGLLIAASDLSGAYLSRDDGQTWNVVGSVNGLNATHVSSLGLNSEDPDHLLIGTDDGLFESNDGGRQFGSLVPSGYVTAIANIGSRAYVAIGSSYDTADSAITVLNDGQISSLESDFPTGRVVLALHSDVNAPDRVLAITGQGRFASGNQEAWASYDGAATWQQLGPELGPIIDARIATNDVIVLSTLELSDVENQSAIHVSMDDGESWEASPGVGGLVWLDPGNPNTIRTIDVDRQYPWDDHQGVAISLDLGRTWDRYGQVEDWNPGWSGAPWVFGPPFDGLVKTLAFDSANPDRALWINSQFLYETRDGGRTFAPLFTDPVVGGEGANEAAGSEDASEASGKTWISRGLDNVVVEDIAVSGADASVWFVGFWDLGCFRSLDAGGSWENCNDLELSGSWQGAGGFMGTVVTDPEAEGVVWAALGQDPEAEMTMVRSSGNGSPDTWEQSSGDPIGIDVLGLSLDPTSEPGERRLFVTVDGSVYRSVDDGRTWEETLDCGGCRTTAVGTSGTVFAGGEAGMWVSNQRGQPGTWIEAGPSVLEGNVSGPPWTFAWSGVSAIDATQDSSVLVTVYGDPSHGSSGGLYRSTDAGKTWSELRVSPFVRTVAVDADSGTIWLGSSSAFQAGGFDARSRGLERSQDGGQTWEQVEIGLGFPLVTGLVVGSGLLLVGSPGAGLVVGPLD